MSPKNRTSYAVPALIYALIVGTTFAPDVRPVLVEAFGAAPFGLPVVPVVAAAVAVLLLPFALALRHFMLIAQQAAKDGSSLGSFGLLAYTSASGGAIRSCGARSSLRCSAWCISCWSVQAGSSTQIRKAFELGCIRRGVQAGASAFESLAR
jgi:hypothetical protein